MKIPLSEIEIGVRQRLDLGDLSDLDSIADPQVGLIQPIVVRRLPTGKYELVAGRRRLAKVTELGWTEVEVVDKENMTDKQKELAEFFEDFARLDRSWQEQSIATYNLFHMLRFEKREEGQTWTVRSMEKFCGRSRSEVHYRLRVAEGLLAQPRDEELWNLNGVVDAYKLLIARANKETTAEKERRRLAAAQAQAVVQPEIITEKLAGENLETPVSVVQNLDPTAPQKAIQVQLFGRNREYDGKEGGFFAALLYRVDRSLHTLALSGVRDGRYIVVFGDNWATGTLGQPIYWNKIRGIKSKYPFYANIEVGMLFSKLEPETDFDSPASGVFTCMDFSEGTELGGAVVQGLLAKITEEGQAVLCLGGINPNDVVDTGRIPVWYEPDPEKYAAKLENLKENYREKYENVEFIE